MTERLETARLVCLDGVGAAAGRPDWEEALFRLFNALESAGTPLIVAERAPPGRLGLRLPDLASRLASGPVLGLAGLDEPELGRVLVVRGAGAWHRASPAGGGLPRGPRANGTFRTSSRFLDRLDRHSLAAQRPVTIPFVRSLIEGGGEVEGSGEG